MGLSDSDRSGAAFYDRWTELFLRGSGSVLQAGMVRTGDPPREDPELSVLALAARAGIADGDRVLDAGCGVGGPATIIARHYAGVLIDAVTNSTGQAGIARRRVADNDLASRVRIHVADYQSLPLRECDFDRVLFFESTGYATDLDAAFREAYRVLEPGGSLYVKDVFCPSGPLDSDAAVAMQRFDRLWGCTRSKTITESVAAMGLAGFEVTDAATMPDIGTARLAGTMVTLGTDGSLGPTEMGRAFLSAALAGPIEFGEIHAVKPRR